MHNPIVDVVLREAAAGRRPWLAIRGWRWLFGRKDLPAVSTDFRKIFRTYGGGLSKDDLARIFGVMPQFRSMIELDIGSFRPLCGLVFNTPSGSVLVVVPKHSEIDLYVPRIYLMGETTVEHYAEIGWHLVETFESAFLPPMPAVPRIKPGP